MEKRCTFCGKELGFLERDVLGCGGTDQPCCKSCHKKIGSLSIVERCQRALQTGRAVDWRTMQGFLEQHQQGEETAKRQAEQRKQQRRTGKAVCAVVPLCSPWENRPLSWGRRLSFSATGTASFLAPSIWKWKCVNSARR